MSQKLYIMVTDRDRKRNSTAKRVAASLF